MITNNGKDIISKYLLSEVPAYATHLAIGCGAVPLAIGDPTPVDLELKEYLDFEMMRVPISSKGFVDDNGTTKVSLTAEIPVENRYKITEVGIWSAGNNSLATDYDGRPIFNFSNSWDAHDTSIYTPPTINNSTTDIVDGGTKIFYAETDDPLFQTSQRLARKEGPRFLNKTIMMRGDTSSISGADQSWVATGTHIHLTDVNFNISNNSPLDVLKFAFSLVDKENTGNVLPSSVKILIQFYKNEVATDGGSAQLEIELSGSDFSSSRYQVISVPIGQSDDPNFRFITSSDFSPSVTRLCKIFVSVLNSIGDASSNHYLALDGMRIENISTVNPVYKMSGYSIVKNTLGNPIIKFENANNYIDFRFSLGIT